MLNSPRQLDMNGGAPILTEHGPAVLVPLAWLAPGQLARVCADRCLKRMGAKAKPLHVRQEAAALIGQGDKMPFSLTLAKFHLKKLREVQ